MILDTIENLPDMSVEVEQNTRCIVHDRLMNYFEKYREFRITSPEVLYLSIPNKKYGISR